MKLCFPEKILNQHLVVLGKTGAGKSSALRHIVEHLLDDAKRTCIIDPKGDWWGLKSSADGKGAGYPVIMFGDFKEASAQDVPINAQSGKHIAELVAGGNRPCVIGFRGWTAADMQRFWIDFAETLFAKNAGELFLVGDEFHNFAPKGKVISPLAGMSLHWSNRLLAEGRGLGLVCLLASQRPQKVHNDTLTSCETLVAMRVIHKADRDAIKDWVDGAGDPELGREVLDSLAGMARGEAFVWSPEIDYGPKRITFPMFETFDSFAPPQLQKKVSQSGWAAVDLEAVKAKLAIVIEEKKANDPTELKRTIADLKKQLATAGQKQPEVKHQVTEKPILTKDAESLLERVAKVFDEVIAKTEKRREHLQDLKRELNSLRAEISVKVSVVQPRPIAKPSAIVRAPAARQSMPESGNGELTPGEIKILSAAAQYPEGVSSARLKVLTEYRSTSIYEYCRSIVAKGYAVKNNDLIFATPDGINALGSNYKPLPEGEALREHWRNALSGGEKQIFEIALEAYPNAVSRTEVIELTGKKATSCYEYTRSLLARKIIEKDGGSNIKVSDALFQ